MTFSSVNWVVEIRVSSSLIKTYLNNWYETRTHGKLGCVRESFDNIVQYQGIYNPVCEIDASTMECTSHPADGYGMVRNPDRGLSKVIEQDLKL